MLFEAVTLHRRFPFAVVVGSFFLDKGAAEDGSERRRSTFLNAHDRFALFSGRSDPAGRDEQLDRLYIVLHESTPFASEARFYLAGQPEHEVLLEAIFADIVQLLVRRNPDFYETIDGTFHTV